MRPLGTDATPAASCSGRQPQQAYRGVAFRLFPHAGLPKSRKQTVLHRLELAPRPKLKLWPDKPRLLYVGVRSAGTPSASSHIEAARPLLRLVRRTMQ